ALLARDGLARPLAGAGVRLGALAADRQAAAVADAPVAADVAQPRDVLLDLPAQLALDRVLTVQDRRQPGQVVVGQLAGRPLRVDAGLAAQPQRGRRADPVQVTQRNVRRLVRRDVNTQDTGHESEAP